MKLFLCIVVLNFIVIGDVFAQAQYEYDPTKLTAEQQHLVERAKAEKASLEKNKNLERYRDEARNPAKYRKFDSYNKERKSYR